MSYELTDEEQAIVSDVNNSQRIVDRANLLLQIRRDLQPTAALHMARKVIAVSIIRRTNPLYGHDEDSLNELYEELKAIEDAETGADRELDYQGPDCTYLSTEEVKAYVLKHNMYKLGGN